MKQQSKLSIAAILFLSSYAAAAQPASVRTADPLHSIIVQAEDGSLRSWTSRVTRDLDSRLEYPRPVGKDDYAEGAVKIAFRCSENGSPAQVSLIQSSKSAALDRAALAAVRSIPTLHPLPDGVSHERPMQAWVIFASDDASAARMKHKLQGEYEVASAKERQAKGAQLAMAQPLIIASR